MKTHTVILELTNDQLFKIAHFAGQNVSAWGGNTPYSQLMKRIRELGLEIRSDQCSIPLMNSHNNKVMTKVIETKIPSESPEEGPRDYRETLQTFIRTPSGTYQPTLTVYKDNSVRIKIGCRDFNSVGEILEHSLAYPPSYTEAVRRVCKVLRETIGDYQRKNDEARTKETS